MFFPLIPPAPRIVPRNDTSAFFTLIVKPMTTSAHYHIDTLGYPVICHCEAAKSKAKCVDLPEWSSMGCGGGKPPPYSTNPCRTKGRVANFCNTPLAFG